MKFDTSKLPTRLDLLDELNRVREEELQKYFDLKARELCHMGHTTFPLHPVFGPDMQMTKQEVEDMLEAFRSQGYYVGYKTSNRLASYVVSVNEEVTIKEDK